jgi:D-sedoheptulose 7-phosphate isomerase
MIPAQFIANHLRGISVVLEQLQNETELVERLNAMASVTAKALRAGGKLLIAGNGGSAADAQHIAAEFVVRLKEDRAALSAIALTTDSSILTAVANDYEFNRLFSRQVEALGRKGDVFLGISTSGNSGNILAALERCKELGITTLGLTGANGEAMSSLCDHVIRIPSQTTAHIQECHLILEHIFCGLVEAYYFG